MTFNHISCKLYLYLKFKIYIKISKPDSIK